MIALLPRAESVPAPLIDDTGLLDIDESVAPVQLLESHEYRYEWELDADLSDIATDPEEVFQPDAPDGKKGRLRPGLATGLLRVVLRSGTTVIGEAELEVRSRKLAYRSEYRWMLRDIADLMTELVMQRFAPTFATFEQDPSRDAITLYERFEFLRALLSDERVATAFELIRRRPHVGWEAEQELVYPGHGLKATAQVVRGMSGPGSRIPWPHGPTTTIPTRVLKSRTEATHDTTANRFIRFALERWRQVVMDVQEALAKDGGVAQSRGLREARQLLERLDTELHDELFKEVGVLTHFPADNQVLHRKEGYRDIFRAYVEFELAAKLSWTHDDSRYRGGQRDVAQLYEYWAFLRLSELIARLVGTSFDMASVLEIHQDGLSVGLRSGRQTVVRGTAERHGRRLIVEFCYNRTFVKPGGTWTLPMRPDYSLIIAPAEEEPARFEPLILHFDAKYRVDVIDELFGHSDGSEDAVGKVVENGSRRKVRRDDLLKMHAYRDAIHRSAGAYVLYPGDDSPRNTQEYFEYRELLPGLGAFVFRPSIEGDAVGSATLQQFLESVLDHVAMRFSAHERGRFWLQETYGVQPTRRDNLALFPFGMPEKNTPVLLGYVKNAAALGVDSTATDVQRKNRGKGRGSCCERGAVVLPVASSLWPFDERSRTRENRGRTRAYLARSHSSDRLS